MTPEVAVALEGSILKWQNIIAGTASNLGSHNCPLCQMFVLKKFVCDGCPVNTRVRSRAIFADYINGCELTPYMAFSEHEGNHDDGICNPTKCEEDKALAEAELAFLISLRDQS